MALLPLDHGTTKNDGTGDDLFDIFSDIKTNFNTLDALTSATVNAGSIDFVGAGSIENRITAAVAAAVLAGADRVFVPASMLPYDAALVSFDTSVQMVREGGSYDVYDVRAYGAVGAGTSADDTAAFVATIAGAIQQSRRVRIPAGKYKLTDEITLGAGLIIEGDGSADFAYGAPPNFDALPSFLYQTTTSKAIFVIGEGMSNVRITDLSLSGELAPTVNVGFADGKIGIKMEGSYPGFIWNLSFERLTFYGLHYAISCVDPNAGTAAPPYDFDWSVAPVQLTNCNFYYPIFGVYIDTNNADAWIFDRNVHHVPTNGAGVYLFRFGFMRFNDCFGGGATVNGNDLIRIKGDGVDSVDNVILDNCQGETLRYFVNLETTGGYAATYQFNLTLRNCSTEASAKVYLGNKCHLISETTRYGANVEIDNVDVTIDSNSDWFYSFGGPFHFTFLTGSAAQILRYFPGPQPDTGIIGTTIGPLNTSGTTRTGLLQAYFNAKSVSATQAAIGTTDANSMQVTVGNNTNVSMDIQSIEQGVNYRNLRFNPIAGEVHLASTGAPTRVLGPLVVSEGPIFQVGAPAVTTADQAIGTSAANVTGFTTALAATSKYYYRAVLCYMNGAAADVHALRVIYSGTLLAVANGESYSHIYGTNGAPNVWAATYRSCTIAVNAAIPTTTGGIGNTGSTTLHAFAVVEGVICTNASGNLNIEAVSSAASGFNVQAGSVLLVWKVA